MSTHPMDPRAVCNAMLDVVPEGIRPPTNLALQKLLYFAHGLNLIERREPLVSGYFEAWRYGPVNPVAYSAFKSAGSQPIRFRATAHDPLTGGEVPLQHVDRPDILGRLARVMSTYGLLSAGQLVDVSHAAGSPWHFVVTNAQNEMTFGLRIGDRLISERFKYHTVRVTDSPSVGEPNEDAPFTRHRSR